MEKKAKDRMEQNWKMVRNRVCIRALLIFLGVILMQMLAYMLCVAGMIVWTAFIGKDGDSVLSAFAGINASGEFLIWVSLVSAFLSMIWCGILYKKSSWREKSFDYRKAFCLKNTMSVIGMGIGGCIVLTMLLSFLATVIPQAFSSYNTIMNQLTDSSIAVTTIYVLLIGPISEEFIFRGAILDRFYLAFPFFVANALQAVLFGVYHMNLIQGLYAFGLGFVLGMFRYTTGSVLASMLAHILFNGTSYVLDFLFPVGEDMLFWEMVILILIGILLLTMGVVYLLQMYRQKTEIEKKTV